MENPAGAGPGPVVAVADPKKILQFVMQVKEAIEHCLRARMSKEQMFQWLSVKKVDLTFAFAVYKELRSQNKSFFKAYYLMFDVNRQIERVNRQLAAYRALQRQQVMASGRDQRCDVGNASSSGQEPAAASYPSATVFATPPLPVAGTAAAIMSASPRFAFHPGWSGGGVHGMNNSRSLQIGDLQQHLPPQLLLQQGAGGNADDPPREPWPAPASHVEEQQQLPPQVQEALLALPLVDQQQLPPQAQEALLALPLVDQQQQQQLVQAQQSGHDLIEQAADLANKLSSAHVA